MDQSSTFKIECIPNRGRALVSGRRIMRGEIILREEPFAQAASKDFSAVVCSYCATLCVGITMYQLSAEDPVRYCSEKCITEDYNEHKVEIEALCALERFADVIGLESLRIIIRALVIKKTRMAVDPVVEPVCGR